MLRPHALGWVSIGAEGLVIGSEEASEGVPINGSFFLQVRIVVLSLELSGLALIAFSHPLFSALYPQW